MSTPCGGSSRVSLTLDATTLVKKDIWTLELNQLDDSDFGGSPTLFTAKIKGKRTDMVGAVNKDGKYRAWMAGNLLRGPIWQYQIGGGHDLSAAVWDGKNLFDAGTQTIGGTPYNGSMRELDPSTGKPKWETGLPGIVFGSPSMDGAGLLAVATYDQTGAPNAAYLIDAHAGSIRATLSTNNSPAFGQVVFADRYVFVGSKGHHLVAYTAP